MKLIPPVIVKTPVVLSMIVLMVMRQALLSSFRALPVA